MTLPDKIRLLDVRLGGEPCGTLLHQSQFEFRYGRDEPEQAAVALLMPPERLSFRSGTLFPVMDQNLPEGYLFMRLRELFPKQPLSAMHLLALIGENGIGRLGYAIPGVPRPLSGRPISRRELLSTRYSPAVFDELVRAYLSTGVGIAGLQPKIMVPDRATVTIPNVIVKTASSAYPGLAANEYLCLKAARAGGIETPDFELSDDGQMLLVDRFDLTPDGQRLGFEDIASLMGLCVRDTLSDRKYQGSYAHVADVLKMLLLPEADLHRFFEQVAFTAMVRNGDGHLKNYGVLYRNAQDIRLAPMFDVVTTSIYRYTRFDGGPELEDRTLALKLFAGRHQTRTYPETAELLRFGREVCGVRRPGEVLVRLGQAMSETLAGAPGDERIPADTLQAMSQAWASGLQYAEEAAR